MTTFFYKGIRLRRGLSVLGLAVLLTGCEALTDQPAGAPRLDTVPQGGASVGRDVERPDVFNVTENALWDGRPSLGGVWVAYPENIDPERVIIRNGANGKSVVGALFRRENQNPGPKIQLSSDAATALGVIAGTPTEITIIVLRREQVEVTVAVPEATEATTASAPEQSIDAPPRRAVVVAVSTPAPQPAPQPAPSSADELASIVEQTLSDIPVGEAAEASVAATPVRSGPLFAIGKPFIQISTFETEANANDLVELLSAEGVVAEVQANDPENPSLFRVLAGPYNSRRDRGAQMTIIKGLGFSSAFFFK